MVRIVGDEDDAQAGVASLDDVPQGDTGLLDTERGRRLVEDDHPRPEVDGPGDRDALALAAREARDRPVEIGDDDPHLAQFILTDALHPGDAQGAQRPLAEFVAEEEVPPHRHERREREVLVDGRDPARLGGPRRAEPARHAVELHRAVGVVVQAGHDLDQRRLTGAVVAEHARDLALADVEADTAQGVNVAVALAHVLEFEDGGVRVTGDVVPLGGRGAHRRSALLLTYMFTSVASSSITPRNVLNQSGFQPA